MAEAPFRYEQAKLPIGAINVLPQPRKTFEEIDSLADDITSKGIMNPSLVDETARILVALDSNSD